MNANELFNQFAAFLASQGMTIQPAAQTQPAPVGATHPVTVPAVNIAQAAPVQTAAPRPVPSVPDNRPSAELFAKVGARKDSRITLPSGLFKDWLSVVLIFPDGFQVQVNRETWEGGTSEGRARISRKLVSEHSGAKPGQYLTFHAQAPGYFIVNVTGTPAAHLGAVGNAEAALVDRIAPVPVPVQAAPTVQAAPAPVTVPTVQTAAPFGAEAWARLFGSQMPQTQAAAPAQAAQTPGKKPRTEKQFAADKARSEKAKIRMAAKQSGVVTDGGPVTPIYAVPASLPVPVPGFNNGPRPVPVANVGAAQMQFAGVVPVPSK